METLLLPGRSNDEGGEAVAFKPLFPAHRIPVILLSLLGAGATLRKKADNEFEDRITNRLFRTLVRMPKFRDGPLGIHLRSEIPPDEDTPGSEIDLLVACGRGYEVYFAIEAKRLRVCSTGGRVTLSRKLSVCPGRNAAFC